MLHPHSQACQAIGQLWPRQLQAGSTRHAGHACRQHVARSAAAAAAASSKAKVKAKAATVNAAGEEQLRQQEQPDPPDVAPHVMLSLDPVWLTVASNCSSSRSTVACQHLSADITMSHADSYTNITEGGNLQQQQQLLVPRTSVRLHGMSLPGFLLKPRAWGADPQLTLWQQQASQIWCEATAWVQQQQQHDIGQELQQQRQRQPPVWLQQLQSQQQPHWGAVAATLEAVGPFLQLQHLAALAQLLAELAESSGSGKMRSQGSDNSNRANGSNMSDPLRLQIIVVDTSGSRGVGSESSSSGDDNGGNSNGSGSSSIVLKLLDVLPKLTLLIHERLQQQQQQQQHHNSPTESSSSSSSLDSSSTVNLLKYLSVCHSSASLGCASSDAVSALVSNIDVQTARLADLSGLISSCARLGHPLRSSWLAAFVQAAIRALQEETAENPASAAAETAGSSSSSTVSGPAGVVEEDTLPRVTARLLDSLSLYPGPHNTPDALQPFLAACEPYVCEMAPADLHMLLTAAAQLSMTPPASLLQSAAAAARRQFGMASLRELVLLLQGLTAFSGGQQQQEQGLSYPLQQQQQQQQSNEVLDSVWWQCWYEATAMRYAAASLAASTADGTPAAAAAAVAADDSTHGSAVQGDYLDGPAGADLPPHFSSTDETDTSQQHPWQELFVTQQKWQLEPEQVSAELFCEVCVVLLEQQQQVHPLWLAGMLEAHHRTAYSAASTPQLLLLLSELLERPAAFAVRHKLLLRQLVQPLQDHLAELAPDQLTQAAEVCRVYEIKPGVEWFRWHAAAVLRFGRAYPLEGLARIRAAYSHLDVVSEERMQQMLDTVPWRLKRQEERQRQQEKLAQHRAALTAKNEQRRRQNEMDKAAKARKKKKGGTGVGPGPDGKQQWRKRKLKPPGTLDRRF